MDAPRQQPTVRFDQVEGLTGFSRPSRYEPAPSFTPFFFVAGEESGAEEEAETALAATGRCTIRRLGDGRYLQCELRFARPNGWMEVWHGGALVDRAELVDGWQHSAIDLGQTPSPADLTLIFRAAQGDEVDGTLVRALFLSDEWGRGQRRRLKCHLPWSHTVVVEGFTVFPCCCPGWLKGDQAKGNTSDKTLAEIWNGPDYRRMRSEFLAGDYDIACREDICPLLTGESRMAEPSQAVIRAINEGHTELDFGPAGLQHDIDKGCNLECVMCREGKILPVAKNIDQAIEDMKCAIEMGGLEHVSFSGAGEVFVMAKVIRLLESDIFSSRDISVNITTNLTNFNEKMWRRIAHNRFGVFAVSIDGCTSEVFESVRIGAHWETVRRNLEFLTSLRREGRIQHLTWNYTVQQLNVGDVGKAVRMARELGFDLIRFIAQFRSMSRTEGNPFEDGDMEALDRVYAQLEAEDAFDDPRVLTSELGVREGRHRSLEHRLEMAEHMFDRAFILGDGRTMTNHGEWLRCVELVTRVRADVKTRAEPVIVSQRNLDFLRRFSAVTRRRASKPRRLIGTIVRRRGGKALLDEWSMALWSGAFARRQRRTAV